MAALEGDVYDTKKSNSHVPNAFMFIYSSVTERRRSALRSEVPPYMIS